jgi:hypothetical protein
MGLSGLRCVGSNIAIHQKPATPQNRAMVGIHSPTARHHARQAAREEQVSSQLSQSRYAGCPTPALAPTITIMRKRIPITITIPSYLDYRSVILKFWRGRDRSKHAGSLHQSRKPNERSRARGTTGT